MGIVAVLNHEQIKTKNVIQDWRGRFMNDGEIVNYLQIIEAKYPVNEWKVYGRYVWPLIKMVICDNLASSTRVENHKTGNMMRNLLSKVKKHKDVFLFNKIDNDNYDVLIYHHNINRMLEMDDGTKFDVNLDPFTLLLEKDYRLLSCEFFNDNHNFDTFRKTYNIGGRYQRAWLCSKITKHIGEADIFLDMYDDFLLACEEGLREKLKINNIYRLVSMMNSYSAVYRDIIKKNRIKFVITGCGYSIDTAAIFMACKDVGVRCMEVQHGLAGGNGHRWYSSWIKMPHDGNRYEMLPDIYWCWTENDKKCIDSWAGEIHTAYWGKRPIYSVLDEIECLTTKKTIYTGNDLPNILFTLQPKVNYPNWLFEVIKKTCKDYNWIIRKHPNFDKSQMFFIERIMSSPNVHVDGVAQIMLEKILINTDLHVTNHSAVTIDALEFGVKTIILSETSKGMFAKQINEKDVFLACDADELVNMLREHGKRRGLKSHISEYFVNENMEFLHRIICE